MRAVNLLPKDAPRQRKRLNPFALAGIGVATLVFGLLSIGLVLQSNKLGSKQSALDTLRATLATKETVQVHPTAGSQYAEEKSQRLAVLATALTGRVAWDRVLQEVGQVLPKNVWLSSLSLKGPISPTAPPAIASSAPSAPTGMTLQGFTYTQEDVARTLARLQLLPDLSQVTLQSSSVTKLGLHNVVQFGIVANVRAPGVGS